MNKNQVATLLEEIGTLLALQENSNTFEVRAYENAARTITTLNGDINELVREGKLKGMPGLGPKILQRVEEAIETGKIDYYDELRANTPPIKLEMTRIPGLGPKRINIIYDQLHVDSIAALEKACKEDRVAHIPGFGKKTQDKILQGIEFYISTLIVSSIP